MIIEIDASHNLKRLKKYLSDFCITYPTTKINHLQTDSLHHKFYVESSYVGDFYALGNIIGQLWTTQKVKKVINKI